MHFVPPDPWVRGNISNRIFPSEVFLLTELLIQDFVKPQRFFVIAVNGVGDFLAQTEEKIGLTEHWPDTAHLKHKPLNDLVALAHILRKELAGLFSQVHQDRARLEQRQRLTPLTVRIDDGRNLIIRIDGKIRGSKLIP